MVVCTVGTVLKLPSSDSVQGVTVLQGYGLGSINGPSDRGPRETVEKRGDSGPGKSWNTDYEVVPEWVQTRQGRHGSCPATVGYGP